MVKTVEIIIQELLYECEKCGQKFISWNKAEEHELFMCDTK